MPDKNELNKNDILNIENLEKIMDIPNNDNVNDKNTNVINESIKSKQGEKNLKEILQTKRKKSKN